MEDYLKFFPEKTPKDDDEIKISRYFQNRLDLFRSGYGGGDSEGGHLETKWRAKKRKKSEN
jgi:hypothetical protein